MPKLTAAYVEKLRPETTRREVPDALVPGLYLVVQPSGKKSWAVRYRSLGKPRKFTIGGYPAHDLAQARDAARQALREVQKGVDPAEGKKKRGNDERFSSAVEDFLKVHKQGRATPRQAKRSKPPRERTVAEAKRYLEHLAEDWGDKPLDQITKAMVQTKLDDIADDSPVAANRVHVYLKMFFEWAVFRDRVAASPVAWEGTPEEARTRALSVEETKAFWKATDKMGWPFGPYFRMLLLTAQRKSEVAGMTWAEVSDGVWKLPPDRSKNGLENVVPLSAQAVEILEAAPRMGGYVFTTTGTTPISGFSRAKANLHAAMGEEIPRWTIHDLRRTASTLMHDEVGIEPHIVEAILNHISGSRGGVAGTYNRAQYIDRKRAALEAWGQYVAGL